MNAKIADVIVKGSQQMRSNIWSPVLVRQQEESESGKNKKQEKYKIVKCPMPASTTYVEQSIFFRNSDIVALGEQLSAILQNVLQFGRHHR